MRIVLATDGSECASAATRFLRRWPLSGAEVEIVSVAEWGTQPVTPDEDDEPDEDLAREMEAEMTSALEGALEVLSGSGASVRTTCLRGDPARQVVGHADRVGADLIVVGSHGRRGITRFLIGSVAHSTVIASTCSVLVVRGDGGVGPIDLLLGLDGSPSADQAVRRLAALGDGALGKVTVVTVILLVTMYRQDILQRLSESFRNRRAMAVRRLKSVVASLSDRGVARSVDECIVESEDAAEALIEEGERMGADLLMVGDSDTRDVSHLVMGSVAARILTHAKASVWIEKGT